MVRDFTAETLNQFISFMDSYFTKGEDECASWWNSLLYGLSVFNIDSAGGDAKKYVRSLGTAREVAEEEINRVWEAVADVEESYSGKFTRTSEQLTAYSDMAKQMQGCIGSGQLGGSYDFAALVSQLKADYLVSLEAKARNIIKKDSSQWTDEELEIVAYVSMNTDDETFPLDAANAFYKKTAEYPGGNYNACQRDEAQWDKFRTLCNYYYAERYQQYLYGDPPMSDSEIEGVIRNRTLIQQIDELPSDMYLCTEEGHPPFTMEKGSGKIGYSYTKDPPELEFQQGAIPRTERSDREFQQTPRGLTQGWIDTNVRFDNGAEISTATHMKQAEVVCYQYDWEAEGAKALEKVGKKYIKKGIEATVNAAVPGTGKVAVEVLDMVGEGVETVNDMITPPDLSAYREGFALEYAEKFRMKLVTTSDGYMALPTPETRQCVERVMSWLEEHKETYPNLYENYYPNQNSCVIGLGTPGDPLNFYINGLNMTAFLQDIRTAGVTNELF